MKHFRTHLLVLIGLSITYHVSAQGSLAALDSKNGFRDAKLGMPVNQLKGLVKVSSNENSSSYMRPSDKKSIGDIPLKKILYTFYKRRLQTIDVYFDEKYTNEVVQTFTISYGKAEKSGHPIYGLWETRKVSLTIIAKQWLLIDNPNANWPCIEFSSLELSQEERDDRLLKQVDNLNKRKSDL